MKICSTKQFFINKIFDRKTITLSVMSQTEKRYVILEKGMNTTRKLIGIHYCGMMYLFSAFHRPQVIL